MNKELRSLAMVLRVRSLGEADKLITLFTRDIGIITAVARGTRKTKSKFSALAEPLTLGRFLLHDGKTLFSLIQGEMVKSYAGLQSDLERWAYAQYFCELCERTLPEGEPSEMVFSLLLTALEALESDPLPARVARCFELGLLDELGFRPALEECRHCGRIVGPYSFDPQEGALVCDECTHPPGSFPVSPASIAVMKRFLELGFHKLTVCAVPHVVSTEIHRVCSSVLAESLGVTKLKTLDFLLSMKLL